MDEYGVAHICGVDEVGRGPVGGPLCACAIVLAPSASSLDIKDSKRLSEKRRGVLHDQILENCLAHAIRFAPAEEIDELGISEANRRAMMECILEVTSRVHDSFTLIDGERQWVQSDLSVRHRFEVDGDAKSLAVAAASIVAKVTRDDLMCRYGALWPEYGFERHKGYGSKEHEAAIIQHGLLPGIHRLSFLKRVSQENELWYHHVWEGDENQA